MHPGVCNTPGQAADSAWEPGASNSSNDQLTNSVHGQSHNFWKLHMSPRTSQVTRGSLCLQARSDFNTQAATIAEPSRYAPLKLRMIAVFMDRVTQRSSARLWIARSKSNAHQGRFEVDVQSVRQSVKSSLVRPMWYGNVSVDGASHAVNLIEERNDKSRAMRTAQTPPRGTWSTIANLTGLQLQKDVDCGTGSSSDTLCMDRLRWTETNDFHDQHIGRVEVSAHFQKTCGSTGSNAWLPAGGLFEAYVDTRTTGLNETVTHDWHDGAGYRVTDSSDVACNSTDLRCTASILTQQFNTAQHGSQINSGSASGSICSIVYDSAMNTSQTKAVRDAKCHIRDTQNIVGRDGMTWSDSVLHRMLQGHCTAKGVCPAGPLSARTVASNLRFRLPEKWSNCVRFRFSVRVSNDDRNLPASTFESGSGQTYSSDIATVYVQPRPRAEEPVLWFASDLSDVSGCLGNNASSCDGKRGVGAIGDLRGTRYTPVSSATNLDKNGAMDKIQMIAGYRSQVRVLAASGATDVESELLGPVFPFSRSRGYN